MTEPRRSTIYDYSDLRLHPDGTRVYQKSTNLRPAIAKVAVQVSGSHWIARDAGGSARIPKFRKKYKKKELEEHFEEEHDVAELDGGLDEVGQESDKVEGGEGEELSKKLKKRKAKRFDGRKMKRQKFLADFNYLANVASTSAMPGLDNRHGADDEKLDVLPEPSPELLKIIHRFAAEFYTESGQLLNSSRIYRKERKARKLRGKQKQKLEGDDDDVSLSPSSPSTVSSRFRSEGKGDEEKDEGDEDEDEESRKKSDRRPIGEAHIDMYKVLDGSAILALGMLVQEQIAHFLTPQIPDGWEDEMRRAYSDLSDQQFYEELALGELERVDAGDGDDDEPKDDEESGDDEDDEEGVGLEAVRDEVDREPQAPYQSRRLPRPGTNALAARMDPFPNPSVEPPIALGNGSEEEDLDPIEAFSDEESLRSEDTTNSDSEDDHR